MNFKNIEARLTKAAERRENIRTTEKGAVSEVRTEPVGKQGNSSVADPAMSETDPPSLILSRKQKPTGKRQASATATTEKGAVSEVRTEPVGDQGSSSVGDPNMSETDPPTLISSQKQNPTSVSNAGRAVSQDQVDPSKKSKTVTSGAITIIRSPKVSGQVASQTQPASPSQPDPASQTQPARPSQPDPAS
jgi:hypothetical protein